jgi:antirestriction protein
MTTTTATASAFFYIDGIPTKGCWVELDSSTTWETIAGAIREKIPGAIVDEILCAGAQGLAEEFLSAYDSFELQAFCEWMEAVEASHLDPEVIAAYCSNNGDWDAEGVEAAEECYAGTYDSDEEFAEDLADQLGLLDQVPENLRYYFDMGRWARDLLMGDYFVNEGHYFHNR